MISFDKLRCTETERGIIHLAAPLFIFVILFAGISSYILLRNSHAATADYVFKSGVAGKCLDDWHQGATNGTIIDLYDCNGTAAQQWNINSDHTIENANGKCLDNWQQKSANGNPIKAFTCTSTDPAEQWQLTGSILKNPQTGKCVDASASVTTNGEPLELYTCNGGKNQTWTASLVGGGSSDTSGGSSGSGSTTEHIISTLYAYPTTASWVQVENAAPTVKYAIVNICAPDGSGSGCGRPADEASPAWKPTIQALQKAGITPLYYISTNYGAEPLSTVEGELANAKAWYGITDPMFDTTSTNNPSYYGSLYSYAVDHGANAVVYNPGTEVPQSYMFGSKEIIQVYEGTATNFRSTSFPSWMKQYPASEFSATLSAGSSANVGIDVQDAAKDNVGNFYEDDESEPPNYATLPTFWQTEVQDVAGAK